MRGVVLASLTFAAFLVAGGRSTSAPAAGAAIDPPTLVPWDRIGNIALGEPRARVRQDYDARGYRYYVLGRQSGLVQGYYRLHRSRVFVTFQDGPVNEIDFTTRYYRTKNGLGVGSRIPLGPCHRTRSNPCEHRWHGFVWNAWSRDTLCRCWVKVGLGRRSLPATAANFGKPWFFIYARGGRATRVHFALKFVD